jgi:hypothetical protein
VSGPLKAIRVRTRRKSPAEADMPETAKGRTRQSAAGPVDARGDHDCVDEWNLDGCSALKVRRSV